MGTDLDVDLEVRLFPGTGRVADVVPIFAAEEEPFLAAMNRGRLSLQRCSQCSRARWPAAPACPYCGASKHVWDDVSQRGVVHSWVRYYRAFLPEFAPVVPYVVVAVELAAGPVIFGRLVDADTDLTAVTRIGDPVRAVVERWSDGDHLLAFTLDRENR
jgi:uncharacterized protein